MLVKAIKLGAVELDAAITALREGLEPLNVRTLADIPSFNTTRAFALYQKIFQPVEHILDGARHVFMVPDGALQSLPLGVLVTKKSKHRPTGFSAYRKTAWLARKYAMTTLPSVSSLRALRIFAKRSKATRPFLGIGDPKLEGKTGSKRGIKLASLFTPRGVADVALVRQLQSLSETYGELRSLARTLGVGDEALLVGSQATETKVKQAALNDYKVLAFATHALAAGDFAGLSGLAKAFFYAGSRALLVSHWPVASDAAVAITTGMLKEAAKPGVGRSEAHRLAMMALIEDTDHPHYAHPMFWAPFVVVGEGGAALR